MIWGRQGVLLRIKRRREGTWGGDREGRRGGEGEGRRGGERKGRREGEREMETLNVKLVEQLGNGQGICQ